MQNQNRRSRNELRTPDAQRRTSNRLRSALGVERLLAIYRSWTLDLFLIFGPRFRQADSPDRDQQMRLLRATRCAVLSQTVATCSRLRLAFGPVVYSTSAADALPKSLRLILPWLSR